MILSLSPQLLLSMPSGGEWLWVFLVAGGIVLLPAIFYLLTLQNTLKAISLPNRKLQPELVWLMFIPLFNMVWHFIVVARIADSLEAEYKTKGHPSEPRPTYNMGLTASILWVCGFIPVIGGLASLAGVVVWIIYWVQVSGHKGTLEEIRYKNGESQIF